MSNIALNRHTLTSHGISRSAHGRRSNYVHAMHLRTDGRLATRGHVKVISSVTKGHVSHALTPEDSGLIWVSANLEDGSTITLPSGTLSGVVGTYYRIKMVGVMVGSVTIALPDGDPAELVGSAFFHSIGEAGNEAAVIVTKDASNNMQGMELDQNDETKGGAPTSEIELFYTDSLTVRVRANIFANTASVLTGASFFQTAGYT